MSAERGDGLRIVSLNIDENPKTATRYESFVIPTLILFKGGSETARVVGARRKRSLEAELELPPATRPVDPWVIQHDGRRVEVDAEREGERVRLWIDGELAVVYDDPFSKFRIGRADVFVGIRMKGEAIKQAELLVGDEAISLTPPPGLEGGEQPGPREKVSTKPAQDPAKTASAASEGSLAEPWTGRYGGRRVTVQADEEADEVRLFLDGREAAVIGDSVGKTRFGGGGVLVEARVRFSGAIKRAEVVGNDSRVPLDPPPDTKEGRRELARRARRDNWRRSRLHGWIQRARERRRLAEDSPWRHLVRGVLRVAIPLVGVTALFGLLPDIHVPLPSIHLDLPTIPSPALPTISLPPWLEWLLDRSHFVVPILIGLVLSLVEFRRRRAGHRDPSAAQTKAERLGRRMLGQNRDRG
jgi:hypothetical protein